MLELPTDDDDELQFVRIFSHEIKLYYRHYSDNLTIFSFDTFVKQDFHTNFILSHNQHKKLDAISIGSNSRTI